jgi:hypothetical protein
MILTPNPWQTLNLWANAVRGARRAELTELLAQPVLGAMEESRRPCRLA